MQRPETQPLSFHAVRLLVVAVVAAWAVAFAPAAPAAEPALAARLSKALTVPHVDPGRSAALAVDLQTGEVVFSRRNALSLAPASTEKLAVSYALLVNLGPSYRIPTTVYGDGPGLEGTTWRGNVVLKGFGDPTLSAAGLRKLAGQVRALGIRRVTGSVVADESYFDARRTAPGWRSSYYIRESAPLSALVVDQARYRGGVTHRPALAAALLFRGALTAAGIQVAGGATLGRARGEALELAAHESPPLLRILRTVNRESDNFTAEQLLKHLGAATDGKGTSPAGAAVVTRTLRQAGVPLGGVRVVDGSGLSLRNRLTADALVGILTAAWADPAVRRPLLSSLAVAGESGTLKRRLRGTPAAGRVFAKTGTTRQACTLAGYVGTRYAFAVLQNGAPVSSSWARVAQDRFVTVLARHQR